MRLSDEIENQRFEVAFRGYNTREVDEFLAKLHSDVEDLQSEHEALRKKVAAAELLAKDAEDRTEEFMASMKADRDSAAAELEAAKTEGERIIREAKNAASGIMAEVRRRAGEISQETRRASASTVEEAKRAAERIVADAEGEAARITGEADAAVARITDEAKKEAARLIAAAKAEAEKLLFAARTESDNTVKAAAAEARAAVAEAQRTSSALSENAARAVALCTEYITEIRATADSVCRELDIELKNAAARISILGQRISRMDVTPPELETAEEESAAEELPQEPEIPESAPDTAEPETDITAAPEEPEIRPEPAYAKPEAPSHAVSPKASDAKAPGGGYFTEEYRQVMEELFGEDVDISAGSLPEDDDTYDYLDKMSVASAVAAAETADDADTDDDDDLVRYNDDEESGDTVTSEYVGLGSEGDDDELLDVFSTSTVDKVYKAPTDDDIDDILNGF